jgi:predicted metal-dependent peptidase
MLFNIAHDACVNALLEADGILLPKGSVPAAPLDKIAEELYDEWKQNAKKIPKEWARDCLPGGEGQNAEELTERWTRALAQTHGMVPQSISRRIANNAEPKLRPEDIIPQFITRYTRADSHTWARASRRVPGMAPGWKREPATEIALVVDTSGSMTDSVLAPIMATVRTFLAAQGVTAHVLSADAAVGLVVEPGQVLPDSLPGGGGTDFRPALAKCETLDGVAAVLYFTDGCGEFPSGCSKPVLWVLTHHNVQPPFGQSIYID